MRLSYEDTKNPQAAIFPVHLHVQCDLVKQVSQANSRVGVKLSAIKLRLARVSQVYLLVQILLDQLVVSQRLPCWSMIGLKQAFRCRGAKMFAILVGVILVAAQNSAFREQVLCLRMPKL